MKMVNKILLVAGCYAAFSLFMLSTYNDRIHLATLDLDSHTNLENRLGSTEVKMTNRMSPELIDWVKHKDDKSEKHKFGELAHESGEEMPWDRLASDEVKKKAKDFFYSTDHNIFKGVSVPSKVIHYPTENVYVGLDSKDFKKTIEMSSSHNDKDNGIDSCNNALEPEDVEVTLVTQTTENRMWMIREYCKRWPGKISVSIASHFEPLESLWDELTKIDHGKCVDRIDLVYFKTKRSPDQYPINKMRNAAIQNVKTSHYLYIDIDFWPASALHEILHFHTMKEELGREGGERKAYVIPAFQLNWLCDVNKDVDCSDKLLKMMPKTRAELFKLIKTDKVATFDFHIQAAHGTTDVRRWYSLKKSSVRHIECMKSNRYEPYVILRHCQSLPPYQEQFSGYGKNKIQHILHLRRLGYSFSVVGHAWVVHWPHNKSESKRSWNRRSKFKGKISTELTEEDDNDENLYHREKMDKLFIKFKAWLQSSVETDGETEVCEGAPDDDKALTVVLANE